MRRADFFENRQRRNISATSGASSPLSAARTSAKMSESEMDCVALMTKDAISLRLIGNSQTRTHHVQIESSGYFTSSVKSGCPRSSSWRVSRKAFRWNTADFSQPADLRTGVSPRVEWPISRLQPTPVEVIQLTPTGDDAKTGTYALRLFPEAIPVRRTNNGVTQEKTHLANQDPVLSGSSLVRQVSDKAPRLGLEPRT